MDFETCFSQFFRRARLFKSELGVSPNWLDVIPREVTLKKCLDPCTFANKTNGAEMSPFEEVSTVPYFEAETEATRFFRECKFDRVELDEDELAINLFDAVFECIEKSWHPEKFHCASISSGFDTRLIAYIISELRKKHGDEWIRDLVFYEIGEEGGEARKVLEYLDLDYPFYYLNEGLAPDEIYEDNLDFSRAGIRHGITGWPVNYWYDPLDRLRTAGIIPEDTQSFTGYACNETSRCTQIPEKFIAQIGHEFKDRQIGNDLAYYFYWIYYCAINSFPLLGEWVHPWYSFNVMQTFYSLSLNQGNLHEIARKGGSVSEIIVKHVNPGLYEAATHLNTKAVEDLGYRRVSGRLMKKAIDDYDRSWYGRTVKPEVIPNPFLTYNDWWGYWNLASLCEYLINNGYAIRT